jgi:hypothetical protein
VNESRVGEKKQGGELGVGLVCRSRLVSRNVLVPAVHCLQAIDQNVSYLPFLDSLGLLITY